MGKLNIVRPDGSVFTGTTEELSRLQLLGNYRPEETAEMTDRVTRDVDIENSTGAEGKLGAAAGGILSGFTAGLSDMALAPGMSEFERDTQVNNPGTRIAGEIGGAILGAVTGVGPAGAVAKLATKAGKAVGGIKGAIVASGIEGFAGGGQQAISTATLNNDPVTISNLAAGAGWGTIYGMGLGGSIAALGKGMVAGSKLLKPKAVPPPIKFKKEYEIVEGYEYLGTKHISLGKIPGRTDDVTSEVVSKNVKTVTSPLDDDAFVGLKGSINEMSVSGYKTGDDFTGALKTAQDDFNAANKLKVDPKDIAKAYQGIKEAAEENYSHAVAAGLMGVAKKEVGVMRTMGAQAMKAVDSGDFAKASEALKKYSASIKKVESITGYKTTLPSLPDLPDKAALQAALKSAKAAVETRAAANILDSFPDTSKKFLDLNPKKAEELFAALDNVLTNYGDEASPIRASVESNIQKLVASSGIKAEGGAVAQLREAWKIGKLTGTKEYISKVDEVITNDRSKNVMFDDLYEVPNERPVFFKAEKTVRDTGPFNTKPKGAHYDVNDNIAANAVGATAATLIGGGIPGIVAFYGAKSLMLGGSEGLSALKSSVQNRLAAAGKTVGTNLQKQGAVKVAAAMQPLYKKLDGSRDEHKTAKEGAKARINEVTEIAPSIKDILYTALEPLIGSNPEVAAALHQSLTSSFNALWELLPKDPGVAISGMKSLWNPSPLQVVETAAALEVFHHPVAVIEEMLAGNINVYKANALKAIYPPLWEQARTEAILNLDFSKLNYSQQTSYGLLLDLPIHSNNNPEYIAESQALFMATPESAMKKPGGGGNKSQGLEPPTLGQTNSRVS